MKKRPFYCGESMRGVFRSGDELLWSGVARGRLRRGDVVIFPDGGGKMVVHRVVRLTPEGPVTMGDNNPAPDLRGPGKRVGYRKVTGFFRRGVRHRVYGGMAGMLQFRRNRLLRLLLRLGHGPAALVPGWLRIRSLERTTFGNCTHYRWRGRLIAVDDGRVLRFRHPLLKLFFAPVRPGETERRR